LLFVVTVTLIGPVVGIVVAVIIAALCARAPYLQRIASDYSGDLVIVATCAFWGGFTLLVWLVLLKHPLRRLRQWSDEGAEGELIHGRLARIVGVSFVVPLVLGVPGALLLRVASLCVPAIGKALVKALLN